MTTEEIITWMNQCPVIVGTPDAPTGETLIPNYLPSLKGWSLTLERQAIALDILGNRRTRQQLKITRRLTIPDSAARLAVFEALETLAEWAAANPPDTATVRVTGLPEFESRAASGTEDISVTLTLESDA